MMETFFFSSNDCAVKYSTTHCCVIPVTVYTQYLVYLYALTLSESVGLLAPVLPQLSKGRDHVLLCYYVITL